VSNNIIPMNEPHRPAENALDEFLSESAIQRVNESDRHQRRIESKIPVEPIEVVLEPIQVIWKQTSNAQPQGTTGSSPVEIWPMLAAALVTLGVSLLALALFARYTHL
jgi:hypothetical protein